MSPQKVFQRTTALPQDHGSWVFLLSPLLIGLFAGGSFSLASLCLVVAAMGAFLIRQPLTIAVKAYSGRRPRSDLPAARFWMVLYTLIILVGVVGLVLLGKWRVLLLTIPGLPIFVWHLYLVSQRAERRQAGVEILATGVLALAAPAAYWIGKGTFEIQGWVLWILCWLQSAASIVHAYMRLEQRSLAQPPTRHELWKIGRRAFLYTFFNVVSSIAGSLSGILPFWIPIPFLLQWVETSVGIFRPAIGIKPVSIGLRQLLVSTLFTVLFIIFWR